MKGIEAKEFFKSVHPKQINEDIESGLSNTVPYERCLSLMAQYANIKAQEAERNLINDIKDKVAKFEEVTNIKDFAFDVINLLKSIQSLNQNQDEHV